VSMLDVAVVGTVVLVGKEARSVIVAAFIFVASSCKDSWEASAGLEGDIIGDSIGELGEEGEPMEDELTLSELGEGQSVSCFDTPRFTLALLFWNQICTRLDDIPN